MLVDLGDMQLEKGSFFAIRGKGNGEHFLLDFSVWNVI